MNKTPFISNNFILLLCGAGIWQLLTFLYRMAQQINYQWLQVVLTYSVFSVMAILAGLGLYASYYLSWRYKPVWGGPFFSVWLLRIIAVAIPALLLVIYQRSGLDWPEDFTSFRGRFTSVIMGFGYWSFWFNLMVKLSVKPMIQDSSTSDVVRAQATPLKTLWLWWSFNFLSSFLFVPIVVTISRDAVPSASGFLKTTLYALFAFGAAVCLLGIAYLKNGLGIKDRAISYLVAISCFSGGMIIGGFVPSFQNRNPTILFPWIGVFSLLMLYAIPRKKWCTLIDSKL